MTKSPKDISDKVQDIFTLAKVSTTPMSVLSLQSTILLGDKEWTPLDVERVNGEVVSLLIKHGWTKIGA